MDTDAFLEAVRMDLQAMTAGDESALAVSGRIARALEAGLRVHLQDVLGQAALELSEQIPIGRVDVRLSGRDVQLVYVEEAAAAAAKESTDEGGSARLTLRMSDSLKNRVEQAADLEGISTNAWLVRAVQRGLDLGSAPRRRGHRITGFARS